MGEARREALRVSFDRSIKLEFHGAKVSSDSGLVTYRDRDEARQLTAMATEPSSSHRTTCVSFRLRSTNNGVCRRSWLSIRRNRREWRGMFPGQRELPDRAGAMT